MYNSGVEQILSCNKVRPTKSVFSGGLMSVRSISDSVTVASTHLTSQGRVGSGR